MVFDFLEIVLSKTYHMRTSDFWDRAVSISNHWPLCHYGPIFWLIFSINMIPLAATMSEKLKPLMICIKQLPSNLCYERLATIKELGMDKTKLALRAATRCTLVI